MYGYGDDGDNNAYDEKRIIVSMPVNFSSLDAINVGHHIMYHDRNSR